MEYKANSKVLCLEYKELVPKIMTAENFRQMKVRGNLAVSCAGGKGRVILVEFETMPDRYKALVRDEFGDPYEYVAALPLKALVVKDAAIRQWFADYVIPSTQKSLSLPDQLKYARQCEWLAAMKKALTDKKATKDILNIGIEQVWERFSKMINNDDEIHGLPTSVDRLRRRYKLYCEQGCKGMVPEWRFGNDFHRKVTPKIEWLVLSLWARTHKPYLAEVCSDYKNFMKGELQLVDIHPDHGGEVFNPMDFYILAPKGKAKNKKGEVRETIPYALAPATVAFYIKKPSNEAILNKARLKGQEYNSVYRPSVKRIGAYYAFSKITMDDIDLPFQGPDGSRIVKTYQAFDCASEAVIGVSFGQDKGKDLIMECMRDMFRLIIRNGWGVPWEIEMERHLTSAMKGKLDKETGEWTDDIYTPGAVFPATRICQSAQAKRAEGFIKKKKYGYQKKRDGFQGRFYAKLLTNRLNEDQKPLRQAYEDIVQNELDDIAAYNNELHPKQDLYPGLTRWQVLEQHQNPQLAKYQAHQVIQFIGYSTPTSIRAGKAQVHYGDYVLPDILLTKNLTYNGELVAYYLPDENGMVNSVFLYEDGQFLCEAHKKMAFREAVIEQTADDIEIMQQQWGQQKRFDKMVRDGENALVPIAATATKALPAPVRKALPVVATAVQEPVYLPAAGGDMKQRALADI